MADRYEVFEPSVAYVEGVGQIPFAAGEHTPKGKDEREALELLTKTDPPMARRVEKEE